MAGDRVQCLTHYPWAFASGPKSLCPTQQTEFLQLSPVNLLRWKFMNILLLEHIPWNSYHHS
jgi:hypothetical protein